MIMPADQGPSPGSRRIRAIAWAVVADES